MSAIGERSRFADASGLAARLKHRVTFQERSRTDDDAGGAGVEWQDVVTVWAEIRSVKAGSERAYAGRLEVSASHEMVVRYRDDLSCDMRVSYDGRLFNIRRLVNVDEAGVILELLLEEGVAL